MSFLTHEQLIGTFETLTPFRKCVRRLARKTTYTPIVGAVVLSTSHSAHKAIGPEYDYGRKEPSMTLLHRLSMLAAEVSEADAGLLISSRHKTTPDDALIHPVQLKHYAVYAQAHEGAIGGSIRGIRSGQITLVLFARKTAFDSAPLQALSETASQPDVANAIANSGLVKAQVQFDNIGVPISDLNVVRKLF